VNTETTIKPYGANRTTAELRAAFTAGRVPVAVYGLGKMGLPIAAVYAENSGNVRGVDIDPAVVDRINDGDCPITGEPGLPALVSDLVSSGALEATDSPERAAAEASVHVVIVPTVVDDGRTPDLSALDAVTNDIAGGLDNGDMVVLESTVPPGTCTERVRPRLEAESGPETDSFGLAFAPERTASGRALADIRGAYQKIVGGFDKESTRVATAIYDEISDNEVYPVSDTTTAECVKVFEGVYRDVNIALANELGTFADDLSIDVREAIAAANTQPYCDIHDPGPGVGGHCIPYYPWFVVDSVDNEASLIETARSVNESMPAFTVDRVIAGLSRRDILVSEAQILLLGVTYRPGIAETREAPAYPIATLLRDAGATVYAADPVLDDFGALDATPVDVSEVSALSLDAAVLITPHESFDDIDWSAFTDLFVLDSRDALDDGDVPHEVDTLGVANDPDGDDRR